MQPLRLRAHPQWLDRAKHLHWITVVKLAILAWRYLHLPKMRICNFKPLLTWGMIKNVDTSVTTQISVWHAAQEPCINGRSFSYNFLVADTTDTAQPRWGTSHLDTSLKCTLSYWLATLQHIPCLHSTFDVDGASLQHQPTSLNRVYIVFLALTQLRYRYTIVAWPLSAQQVACLCLSSLALQLAPISTRRRF